MNLEVEMRGGKRMGSGRKKTAEHLRRELVTIRLPKWIIMQLKKEGEMGYIIENQLLKADFINQPLDYKV